MGKALVDCIGPNQTPRQLKATNVFVNAPLLHDIQIYELRIEMLNLSKKTVLNQIIGVVNQVVNLFIELES